MKNLIIKTHNYLAMIPVLTFLLLATGLIVRNFLLAHVPFYDWDEAIYTQVASEMLHHHSIITTYNGALWLEKPPLVFALLATVFAVFGESEFWARFLIVIATLFLLYLLYRLAKKTLNHLYPTQLHKLRAWQREIIYLLPIFVTATTTQFLDRSALVNVDVFLAVSWLGYFLFQDSFWKKLIFLFVGVMSKSLLGFYPFLFELFLIRKSSFTKQNVWKTIALLCVPLIWHLFAYTKFGSLFIQVHFLDHMLRRLTDPIELHFGNKYFFADLLWQNFTVFLLIIGVGAAFVLFDLVKRNTKLLKDRTRLWDYLVLLSPLPFLVLLTFGKSKLSWYLFPVLPILSLFIPYVLLKIKYKVLQQGVIFLIVGFSLYQFSSQMFFIKPSGSSEKVVLANCLSKLPQKKIAFLVDEDERKIQNVLEASHLAISTSFNYGGTPSFVYYAKKPVHFYYSIQKFNAEKAAYPLVVIAKKDLPTIQVSGVQNCVTQTWVSFVQ
ncbi:hypothetical protein HGA88_00745 [Candidatus Roizmanbacteria bacterium]|nr:hypothetical protein [Candidatus Roizmanbacteria bacterium]